MALAVSFACPAPLTSELCEAVSSFASLDSENVIGPMTEATAGSTPSERSSTIAFCPSNTAGAELVNTAAEANFSPPIFMEFSRATVGKETPTFSFVVFTFGGEFISILVVCLPSTAGCKSCFTGVNVSYSCAKGFA